MKISVKTSKHNSDKISKYMKRKDEHELDGDIDYIGYIEWLNR